VSGALDAQAVRRFYDRFGSKQDRQSFYEDPGLDVLVREGDFGQARHVFEFGCGTGRFADRLLSRELPPDARYEGVDLSSTMVDLASQRLGRFPDRAKATRAEGSVRLPLDDASFDRVVATYVLDILADEEIGRFLAEAHRVLRRGGLLCTLALTQGCSLPSRLLARAWSRVHSLRPTLVGGCRPIEVADFLDVSLWRRRHRSVVVAWAVPSEVLVAEAV
jgi:ubiquinone/menaquinone biosynthesis C-methylase UbiE